MKKIFIYFIGVILIALSVALNYKVGFGSSSIDCLTKNIADAINLNSASNWVSVGAVLTVLSLIFILVYYICTKSKDIYFPLIVAFILGLLIDMFINLLSFKLINIYLRILFFIISINIMAIGVSLLVYTKLSPTAYECLSILVCKKILKNVSYGIAKVIVEAIVIILACIVGFIFLGGFGEVSIATIIMLLFLGPLIDLYLKLLNKIKKG